MGKFGNETEYTNCQPYQYFRLTGCLFVTEYYIDVGLTYSTATLQDFVRRASKDATAKAKDCMSKQ